MWKKTLTAAVAIAVLLVAASVAVAAEKGGNDKVKAKTPLSGDSERPNPVDTEASGSAKVMLKMKGDEVKWFKVKVTVCNISNATAAHIHAPAGDNETAGAVLFLYGPGPSFNATNCTKLSRIKLSGDELSAGLINIELDDFIEALKSGRTYVNVHTSAYPGGEIRGQLD